MIDNLAILIFSTIVVYTVYKAVQLDKSLPWFGEAKQGKKDVPEDSKNS